MNGTNMRETKQKGHLEGMRKRIGKDAVLFGVVGLVLIVFGAVAGILLRNRLSGIIPGSEYVTDVVPPEPDRSVSMLKVGFVTDFEYGSRKRMKHKLTAQAPAELRKAVEFFNMTFHPDVVVGGGDYIESSAVKPPKAKEQLAFIDDIFAQVEAPRLYALGNHDFRSLTREEVLDTLGLPETHAIYDSGDWRLIVLDTNFNPADGTYRSAKSYVGGFVNQKELDWLREALRTDRPVVVFSHHSPIATPNSERAAAAENIGNAAEVRSVLEDAGNVVAVVSGHTPMTYYEHRNGIHYFIVDTMVNEPALGSFATIWLGYAKGLGHAEIRFRQLGTRSVDYVVDWNRGDASRYRDMLTRGEYSSTFFPPIPAPVTDEAVVEEEIEAES